MERRHLELFLEVSGLASKVTEIVESERPDFLFSVRNLGRIALEHTQPRDAVRAAHSQLLVDLCEGVCRELKRHKLPLWVHMTFDLEVAQALAPWEREQQKLARELVTMVTADRMKVATRWTEYERGKLLDVSPTFAPLSQVHVSEAKRPIATWGTKTLRDRLGLLESAIASKAQKLEDYRNHVLADEFWLLVVSGPGLGCLPGQLAPAVPLTGEFRQIYAIDEYGQHWYQLVGN